MGGTGRDSQLVLRRWTPRTRPALLWQAGVFKGLVRVLDDPTTPPPFPLTEFFVPKNYVVRVYVLRGMNLAPMDAGTNSSDPYLKLKCGKVKINDRENAIYEEVPRPSHISCCLFCLLVCLSACPLPVCLLAARHAMRKLWLYSFADYPLPPLTCVCSRSASRTSTVCSR